MSKMFTPVKITKLYRLQSKRILLKETNTIPAPARIKWGKYTARAWQISDLPAIGKVHGFLPAVKSSKVLVVYTAKGGVLKTTLAYNLARMLALNGIKTLVIGLDVQCSITDLLSSSETSEKIELTDIQPIPGLYEIFNGGSLGDIIKISDLPTLHYIPENPYLTSLEQRIRDETNRERLFEKFIAPLKQQYDIILFDNSPNWNFLIRNSLVAANVVISPIGCDIGTYRAVNANIQLINKYKEDMDLTWDKFIIVPTLLENTNLSLQIVAQYNNFYAGIITKSAIRRAIKGQESSLQKYSVIETDPSSPLANDYYDVVTEIWTKIRG